MKFAIFTCLIIYLLAISSISNAQDVWKGNKKCAVCLTYDDAMDSQLDNVVPQLNQYGFKGTFYLKGSSRTIYYRMNEWRAVATDRHELGNHTIFHPCSSENLPGIDKDKDLDNYTLSRFLAEVEVSNTLLKAIDGKDMRTFAYTCGDMQVEGKNICDYLPKYVSGARGGSPVFLKKEDIDLYKLPSFSCTGKTAEKMIKMVQEAKEKNSLLILIFHGVGGGYLLVDKAEHEKLLIYLKENEKDIWVAPVIDVVNYLKLN